MFRVFTCNRFCSHFKRMLRKRWRARGTAEYCIFLNLAGGASHVDTFDIKEERWTPPDFDIRTIKPGVRMPYGLFPELSKRIGQLILVRSMQAWENEHIRAQYYLQVAHPPSPARMKGDTLAGICHRL